MHEARFYTSEKNNVVICNLCPWNCSLRPGQTGNCKVRSNEQGSLVTSVYDRVAAMGVDPIEKKPFYHFFPGRNILSIGEVGCNLHCKFCQNHRISQCFASDFKGFHDITPLKIANESAKTWNNIGVAFTYNEPFTFYEFMVDTAKLVNKMGLKNVVVSNGYVNPEPLQEALPFLDAFNIDLKAFSDEFYIRHTSGQIEPVLNSLKIIAKHKKHLEITNLIIPGLNDNEKEFREMIKWISRELGSEVPLHLSRYFPQYKSVHPPTSIELLEKFYGIAKKNLKHVYLGNVTDQKRSSTYCSKCNALLIERHYYRINFENIDDNNTCLHCKSSIDIVN